MNRRLRRWIPDPADMDSPHRRRSKSLDELTRKIDFESSSAAVAPRKTDSAGSEGNYEETVASMEVDEPAVVGRSAEADSSD